MRTVLSPNAGRPPAGATRRRRFVAVGVGSRPLPAPARPGRRAAVTYAHADHDRAGLPAVRLVERLVVGVRSCCGRAGRAAGYRDDHRAALAARGGPAARAGARGRPARADRAASARPSARARDAPYVLGDVARAVPVPGPARALVVVEGRVGVRERIGVAAVRARRVLAACRRAARTGDQLGHDREEAVPVSVAVAREAPVCAGITRSAIDRGNGVGWRASVQLRAAAVATAVHLRAAAVARARIPDSPAPARRGDAHKYEPAQRTHDPFNCRTVADKPASECVPACSSRSCARRRAPPRGPPLGAPRTSASISRIRRG